MNRRPLASTLVLLSCLAALSPDSLPAEEEQEEQRFIFMTMAANYGEKQPAFHRIEEFFDEVGIFLQEPAQEAQVQAIKDATGWKQQFYLNRHIYGVNWNSEEGRKTTAGRVAEAAKMKVYDTFMIDEPRYGGGRFHEGTYGPYDEDAKARFIEYLKRRYSSEALRKKCGITDLEKELVFSDEMGAKQPYLFHEFKRFHWWVLADYLNLCWDALKKANPEAKTWLNLSVCSYDAGVRYDGVDYSSYSFSPQPDLLSVDPYAHIRQNNQYWDSFGTNIIATFATKPFGTWVSGAHVYLTTGRHNQLGLLAAFGQGAKFFGWHAYTHGLGIFKQDRVAPEKVKGFRKELLSYYRETYDRIADVFSYIRENNWLYPYRSEHKVCIYFPTNTYLTKYFNTPWCKQLGAWGTSYFCERAYYSLLRRHIPADVLLPPVHSFVEGRTPEQIVRDKLKQYEVIILPDAEDLSDTEIGMFKEWVRAGGLLIATGTPGKADEAGSARRDWPLADLFGCSLRKEAHHRYFAFTKEGREQVFKSFPEDGYRVFSEVLPKTQYLSVPYFKSVYMGDQRGYYKTGPTHLYGLQPANRKAYSLGTYCYKREEIRNLDPKGVSFRRRAATTLAKWEDGSSAIVANDYGEGRAILCSSTDILVGYEVDGWHKDEFLNMLADMVRSKYHQVATQYLSPQVELNLLANPDRSSYAVTFLNYDAKPYFESFLKLRLPSKVAKAEFIPLKGKNRTVRPTEEDGVTLIKVPRFGMFAMLRLDVE